MWETLLQNFAKKNVDLHEEEMNAIQSVFRYKKYRKSQYILQQGDVARCETFVVRGLTRTYVVDDQGQEHILYFGPEDSWVGDLYSHYLAKPSRYNIDCIEETEVLQITKASLEDLCSKIPKLNVFFRHLYRNSIIAHETRASAIFCKTALERYLDFVDRNAHLEQRISNHQIAQYLGITPQSLSRIRRRHAQKLKRLL
jgi:CRP-like cAMP-binding protein